MTRRDRCYLVGKRAARLSRNQSVVAWHILAMYLDRCADMDIPKFRDLLRAIRIGTIEGRKAGK